MATKRTFSDVAPETTDTPSKIVKTEDVDSLTAAAAIAAKIAAQYSKPVIPGEDAPFEHSLEINDLKNRYTVTKATSQAKILADTGATVTTKGVWYPDKSMATDKDPPLYLHTTALTQESLDAGVKAVQDIIDQELGPLIDQSRFRDRDAPRERRKWPEEKVWIEVEPLRNFNVRAKVVGPGGLFVKYIQQETQTRVQIKGQNSGFVETETGRESDDKIHIHVTGPDQVMVDKATLMAKDLLVVVKEEWNKAKSALENGTSYGQQQQQQNYGQQQQGYGQQQQQYQGYGQQQYQQQGYAPPLPAGDAPPLPPGESPAPPPPSMPGNLPEPPQPVGGTATPQEWTAYWQSLDGASQAYYLQYYAVAPAPAPEAPRGGSGQYGAVPPPHGL